MAHSISTIALIATLLCSASVAASATNQITAPGQPNKPGRPDRVTITNLDGTVYERCKITRVEPDGITVVYAKGVTKIPFPELPEEYRKKYGYTPIKAYIYSRAVARKRADAAKERAMRKTMLANPISKVDRYTAKEDLKNSLESKYGNSYSTIEMLLKAGMKAYDELCKIPDNSVNNRILRDLKAKYYPSFSTILMLYKSNKKSYNNLNK